MWPFNKKTLPENIDPKNVDTVLCIPGNWESREQFILDIVRLSDGEYIAAGQLLFHTTTKTGFEVDFTGYDERMADAFAAAGQVNSISDSFVRQVAEHRNVVYLIGNGGDLGLLKKLALAANLVLKAGGIGVKVETAGKAFEKEHWSELANEDSEAAIYHMFVLDSIVDEHGSTYSCGMHNLGFKDTIVTGEAFQDAVDLIKIFSFYQIIDKPEISSGQTFSQDNESAKFRILETSDQPSAGVELFENPFGIWRLERV